MQTRLEAPVQEPRFISGHDAVELTGVRRAYPGPHGPVPALDGVTLRAVRGEVVALVGPSGCGKSTLLELVCGLQRPDAGTVRSEPAVLMPQRDLLLPWLDAVGNAALPLRNRGLGKAQARAAAGAHFPDFGLAGFERARPWELSGGMRQRVAFLRTFLADKPVLALDEPFGALDVMTRQEMQEWLAGALLRAPRTVLLVTHDVEEALVLADRVLILSRRPGRVVAELPVDLDRPRSRTDARLVALRERAMEALR
jgi:NitT/TauT family transport system ATP-binding protein